ncbi:MAG: hypothetical protein ACO3NK_04460 [Prochlorotrichaceae cyanobacterium]|jgi:hypothetical protein
MGKASDSFKQKLDTNQIGEALKMALGEAIELKITTWVADANDPSAEGGAKPGHRMQTRINIVDGDIENEVGSVFLSQGPYGELRDFHLEQVKQGRSIIRQNLESLQQLFGLLAGVVHRVPTQTVDVKTLNSDPKTNPALPASR